MTVASDAVPDVDGVDLLYRGEPDAFVAARDRLAKELRAGGDREAAAAVRKLRRPTVVAWAVNQVVRTHREEVEELMEATADVQRAQAAALGGEDPGHASGSLREAAHRRRRAVATLARVAADLVGAAHADQAAATVDAASLDPDATALFLRGRLSRELPPPAGFGIGIGTEPGPEPAAEIDTPAGSAGPADEAPPPATPQVDLGPLRREVERAEAVVATAAEDLERAEEGLARATARVETARRKLELAVADQDRARAVLGDAAPG